MCYEEGWRERLLESEGKDKTLKLSSHEILRAARRFTIVIHFSIQSGNLMTVGQTDRSPNVYIIGTGGSRGYLKWKERTES